MNNIGSEPVEDGHIDQDKTNPTYKLANNHGVQQRHHLYWT